MSCKKGNSPARRRLTGLFPLLESPSTKFDGKSRTAVHNLPSNFPVGVCAGRRMSADADVFYFGAGNIRPLFYVQKCTLYKYT